MPILKSIVVRFYLRVRIISKVEKVLYSRAFFKCAGHGTNSVGDKLTTGLYRQV